ncbi:MAG: spermidine/putrescine ABC transporter ATP-binding protein PotA [Desulfomicrobium sp.]|nr:spermidine/putrescine ABC transporter ATP-binding protein PotA [Pseudomonadota bacterium]MBV1710554.1 spermidine/putrescine ABC transporter ATP-binding protein PotA [Desulfomicrobium sp.]MBU4570162.1 spermidine/putrescine ABC transporter ATP-binding protein PotA [Pseudomonadota bacterium]MBU4593082.1 spermidine/putrescine ABC transporter ATP-binding protein PotA [Pseudomonadota bacterium]MBV1718891.1 spermidine/putrescine ABC transporter ATP-binding protein PotA [Desulfomicrobium sp.]
MTESVAQSQALPVVQLRNVAKVYDGQHALKEVSLDVQRGEFLTILGPSGCGKTTILRLVAGFEGATSGSISIDGRDVTDLPPERRNVNTVFQSYALFPHMNVFDNVAFGLRMKGRPATEIATEVRETLRLVQLEGFDTRAVGKLSGGQQQRVAIARAIINRPLVLLLDEPLSALDYRLRKQMQLDLKHLQRKLGITFVLVTHDQEEAFSMSDRVVVMNNGHIEQIGTPVSVYEEPRNLYVARFVGEINIIDAEVVELGENRARVRAQGLDVFMRTSHAFRPKEKVHILLRPEDLRVETLKDLAEDPELEDVFARDRSLVGTVEETIYKGATYDVVVRLDAGGIVTATEFFNEDDETVYFKASDRVAVSWVEGWEVVLPYEK